MDIQDIASMGAYTIAQSVVTMLDAGDSVEEIREAMVDVVRETKSAVPEALQSELSELNDLYIKEA